MKTSQLSLTAITALMSLAGSPSVPALPAEAAPPVAAVAPAPTTPANSENPAPRPSQEVVESADPAETSFLARLDPDQRRVLAWTDRQFGGFFDRRQFTGWSPVEKSQLESRSLDALRGPRSREYYQAINTLAALRSTNALPALRLIAFDRADKDNRDRWMAIRALGLVGDATAIPELIHLVYHGNLNTRWWAQLSLVRLTRENHGRDWEAWRTAWNRQGGQPPCEPGIIRWWSGQPEPEGLAASLADGDRQFLAKLPPTPPPPK